MTESDRTKGICSQRYRNQRKAETGAEDRKERKKCVTNVKLTAQEEKKGSKLSSKIQRTEKNVQRSKKKRKEHYKEEKYK